jgi:glycosyltransferase involved in cell wall biosynthesis
MAASIKILFLTENFPPETNAAATRVFERACYWIKAGHQVTIITTTPNFPNGIVFPGYKNRWWQVENMRGIRVIRVKTYIASNQGVIRRTLDFLSFMVMGILGGLFEAKPDVVVSTSPQFFAAVAGWILAGLRRVPFVFELGDLWPASIAAVGIMRPGIVLRLIEKLELHLYARAESVVSLTYSFKTNLMMRGINQNKIAVIPNGVDLWRYGARDRDIDLARQWDTNGYFIIGYVGTHGMAHALGNILDAAEILRNFEKIRFLLVGAGAEREQLVFDAKKRCLNNIIFMPSQPKITMPSVWSLCDIALVHLKDDAVFAGVIPSKIFEAMAMGLPILMSVPEGEASQIILSEKAGLCIPPENAQVLADTIIDLSKDSIKLKILAENSLAAAHHYSRESQAHHMILVLEQAVKRRGHEVSCLLSDKVGDRS